MATSTPSVPSLRTVLHRVSTKPGELDSHSFGSSATLATSTTRSPALKTPIPAKAQYLSYTMAEVATPTPTPTAVKASAGRTGVFGWGAPAEAAFFISLAILGICLPIGLICFLRRRKRHSKRSTDETANIMSESIDMDGTLRGSTTRPPTASSWLEMLKHRTETPAPPHTNDGKEEEIYYEPPKPVIFARRKFCARLSGRMSEADIEREVRELDEEVRRRSKLSRSRGQSVGVLPDLEDPCSGCASAYTRDARGYTQPVEGRKGTPIPFLGGADVEGSSSTAEGPTDDGTSNASSEQGEGDIRKSLVIETIRVVDDKTSLDG
ncbi:hypothetical protein TWF694_007900 [Orbilia ellipsospora]|uniref:Uncharacterized protein n=1 Tax=Orbilia ellipsospora TaxID=2528407 RepID=A0AAV9XQS0_9PEZI